jgi:hypothetical protein
MVKPIGILLGCLVILATLSGCHHFLYPYDGSYSRRSHAPRDHGHHHGHDRHRRYYRP